MIRRIAAVVAMTLCIACEGPAGPAGPEGPEGPEGPPGMDGAAGAGEGFPYYPVASWACIVTLDLISPTVADEIGQDGIEETYLSYGATVFSNGDVDVSCEGALGSQEVASDSTYYPGVTQGAAIAGCAYSLDYPPYTSADQLAGSWAYETSADGPVAVYHDVTGHPLDGAGYAFEPDDCVVRGTDDDGEWVDVPFDDVFGG